MKNFCYEKWNKLSLKNKVLMICFVALALIILFLVCSKKEDIGTEKAVNELQKLSENIRRFYQNRPDYWGLNTQMAIDKQLYPLSMYKEGVLKSYFGTPVLVGNGINADVLMPGTRNFDIIYKYLNKRQCIEFASYKFNQNFWLGVSGVSIITEGKETLFGWGGENSLPIKKNIAESLCKNDENSIIWHYE